MKYRLMFLMTTILFAGTPAFAAVPDAPAPAPIKIHRFLLAAGANDGGAGRATLRYAVSDARAFAAVLTEMGGVDERNKVFLSEPSAEEMRRGFLSIEQKLNDPRFQSGRREIIVYYSGHADEEGLRLGREIMRWADFRRQVDSLSADLKVAVVDACGSGAITRIKGGVIRPAFLSDASSDMKGYAFLTSSSDSEVSQESDRLRGSFFTHALVSGLRGAADMTGSGTVTLSEAYQFAFNETLHSTQSTMGGVQHPSRDMNLTGTGDVVMTDLRHANSGLTLDADLSGRFFIRDERNFLVAELYKSKGRAIELGLPAGTYSIRLETSLLADNIRLVDGGKTALTQNMFRPVRRERTVSRGGDDVDIGEDTDDDDGMYDDDADDNQRAADNTQIDDNAHDTNKNLHSANNVHDTRNIRHNPLLDSARAAPFSFGGYIVYGYSEKPSRGLQLSLVFNDARAEYVGTQIAIGANFAREDMIGTQVGVGANMASGHFQGVQVSSGLNIAQSVDGAQISSGLSIAQRLNGTQVSVVNMLTQSSNGAQLGVANFFGGDTLNGMQVGVVNIAGECIDIQSGVLNVAAGDVQFVQVGVVNTARDVGYVQYGTLNIAKNVGHLQFGVLNIAETTKRQIGVLNIAKHSEKTPIGILNIVGNGIFEVTFAGVYRDEANISMRTGTPWLYSLVEYGRHDNTDRDEEFHSIGWGLGTRFGMNGPFAVNLELAHAQYLTDDLRTFNVDHNYPFRHQLRLGASYSPWTYIAVTGGIHMTARMEGDPNKKCPLTPFEERFGSIHTRYTRRGHRLHAWPELYLGVSVGRVRVK